MNNMTMGAIRRMSEFGFKKWAIAKQYGVTESQVVQALKLTNMGSTREERLVKRRKIAKAKTTRSAIRRLHAEFVPQEVLERVFGCKTARLALKYKYPVGESNPVDSPRG